jgi:hypothetical protein
VNPRRGLFTSLKIRSRHRKAIWEESQKLFCREEAWFNCAATADFVEARFGDDIEHIFNGVQAQIAGQRSK